MSNLKKKISSIYSWMQDEDFRSIVHQLTKRSRLALMRRFGSWPRIESESRRYWTDARARDWVAKRAIVKPLMIDQQSICKFKEWAARNSAQSAEIVRIADAIVNGDVTVFDKRIQVNWAAPRWNTDWTTGFVWENRYFRQYDHHQSSDGRRPEIKFTWELNRMQWLVTLAQASLLKDSVRYQECAATAVANWHKSNPLANSVNWHPMECAMRALNISFSAMLFAQCPKPPADTIAILLRSLALQCGFLYRNVEYTAVRSNHFCANIVGLSVGAHLLEDHLPESRAWYRYAARHIPAEVAAQYLPDGVQFEGSIPYHRLVTELFLVGLASLDKSGYKIPVAAAELVRAACVFSAAYIRPDGSAPSWGDNDGARVLGFDPAPIEDHRPLLAAGSQILTSPSLLRFSGDTATAALLTSATLSGLPAEPTQDLTLQSTDEVRYFFPHGGYAVNKNSLAYFLTDYGEVGFHGNGGHGHNDTFSFELALQGERIIVDRGCPIYTGNIDTYNGARGTASHNVVEIDGHEMAPIPSVWRISNCATPRNVSCEIDNENMTITGTHDGYRRLTDPVIHTRTFALGTNAFNLRCVDDLHCASAHIVRRYIHLHPGVIVDSITKDSCLLTTPSGLGVTLHWDADSSLESRSSFVSYCFGNDTGASLLVISTSILGSTTLWFSLTPKITG